MMKKIVSILLMLLLVVSLASCGDGTSETSTFEDFEKASYSTLSSRIVIDTKLTTALGELNASVETKFNPDGSATLTYSVEKFDEELVNPDPIITKTGTVTYEDGKYTGDLEGELGSTTVAAVELKLDETKMDYTVEDGVLTATVKAENVKDVLGIDVAADVSFMLTMGAGKITSLTMRYTVDAGEVTVVCSYN